MDIKARTLDFLRNHTGNEVSEIIDISDQDIRMIDEIAGKGKKPEETDAFEIFGTEYMERCLEKHWIDVIDWPSFMIGSWDILTGYIGRKLTEKGYI